MRLILLLFILISCSSTKEYIVPLTTPPETYIPKDITNNKDLIIEYQRLLKHNLQWYYWYNAQVGSNYFNKEELIKK